MVLPDDFEPPSFREKAQASWIALAVLLIIAVGLLIFFVSRPTPTAITQPTESVGSQPSSGSSAPSSETPVVTAEAASAPEMNTKCTVVAGIVPGSIQRSDNSISVTFKNNGKKTIEGSYFEFSSDSKKTYKKNSDAVEPGKTITYSVSLDNAATELGIAVKSFVVLPVEDGKACLNQRMIVIK